MMNKKDFFQHIDDTIKDIKDTDYVFKPKKDVPTTQDPDLTYLLGEVKRGIELNTCVLFVDIRDSVKLNENHYAPTMGKIYTAFTSCVLKAIREVGGYTRNIIGDRVMAVFPEDDCYTKAVDCAIYINQISQHIDSAFPNVNFRCGIGIDYGRMRVIEVGIRATAEENNENKGLVWVGKPANLASRLTDSANKTITKQIYRVEGTKLALKTNQFGLLSVFPETTEIPMVKEYSPEEFVKAIGCSRGRATIELFHSVSSINKVEQSLKYAPILMSQSVFSGFAHANPERNSVKKNMWQLQPEGIRNIDFAVYGGDIVWILD